MNKQRGYFPIELDRPRFLRYTFNSLGILEDHLGVKITKIDPNNMSAKDMITFVWAGLIHEDEGLTKEEVGEMMSGKGEKVFSVASEAIAYCMGGEQAVNESKKQKKAREVHRIKKGGHGRKSNK